MFDALILGWILGSLALAVYAVRRGRPAGQWFLASIVMSPAIAFVLLLVLPDLALEAERHEELLDAMRPPDAGP